MKQKKKFPPFYFYLEKWNEWKGKGSGGGGNQVGFYQLGMLTSI